MHDFAFADEPLFDDLIESIPFRTPMPPFHYTLELLDYWDKLTHGESNTTRQIRAAIQKDFAELGISV